MLKILLTNYCVFNCAYCINRSSNDIPRAAFTSEEVAELTINFYRRNYIEGLFLSSAIIKDVNYTMELMLGSVKLLRTQYRFNGYIHMKAIPGADSSLISEAGKYVDRMSVNIELPSSSGLKLLAPQKSKDSIIKPMSLISNKIIEKKEENRFYKNSSPFVPAGQSTQLIVGATPDNDFNILRLSENLYKRFDLKRVYYSAYVPIAKHPSLPTIDKPPLMREHRLYQADWLLRFYGFTANELLNEGTPNFSVELDPKSDWALRNLHIFPLEINRADISMLLRIPGVGVRSARRIIAARKTSPLDFDNLKKLGVVLKRARYFITCKGKYFGISSMNESLIKTGLLSSKPPVSSNQAVYEQLSMFPYIHGNTAIASAITGEL